MPSGSTCILPTRVHTLMIDHGAWLVGSGVPWFRGEGPRPKDLDLIVPPHNWSRAVRALGDIHTLAPRHNMFGGLTVFVDDWYVDLWPSTVGDYFRQNGFKTPKYAMSLNPNVVLERING